MSPGRAPTGPRLRDVQSAADYTGFSPRQFRRWIEERTLTIPIVRIMGRIYFETADLDHLIDSAPHEIPASVDEMERAAKPKPKRKSRARE